MFPDLNLPKSELRFRTVKKQVEVFDIIRKIYVVLTPEEWVRQHLIHFLVYHKGYPKGLIEVEKKIKLFNTEKRVDILIRTPQLKPLLLVECKEPGLKLTQKEAEQLARYQISLEAGYCMLSSGLQHFVMRYSNEKLSFLAELPNYTELKAEPFK